MKSLITHLAATALLVAAPAVAFAHDGDGWRGSRHAAYSHDRGHGWKHGHDRRGYAYGPVRVESRYYYPAPRVVARPVYVPVPAPVVAPYPYPGYPVNAVDIGFRFFF